MLNTGIVDNSNATAITIDSSENVGIGTNSFTTNNVIKELVVKSTVTNGVSSYTLTTTDNALGGGMRLTSFNDTNALVFGMQTSYNETDTSPPTERMRIDSSGNVGIGTASPDSKLEVYNSTVSGNTQIHVHNDKAGDAAVLLLEGKRTSLNDTGQLIYANSGNNVAKIDARSAGDDGALRFFVSASGTGSNMSEAMSISTAGNVGIGTSSPSQKLDVVGGHLRLDAGMSLQWDNSHERIEQSDGHLEFFVNNSEKMTLDTNGLGIGTLSPFSRVQSGGHTFSGTHGMYADSRVGISNHGTLTGMMLASTYNDASHPEYGLVFVQGPSTSSYNVWSISPDGPAKGNGLNFHYGSGVTNIHQPSNHKITFKGDGKVGIGTNGPGYKLDIVESVGNYAAQITNNHDSSEGLLIRCSDNDNNRYLINCQSSTSATGTSYASQFLITKAGNVSIGGTLSPSATLHVVSAAASNKSVIITRSSGAEAVNLSEMQDYNALQILNKASGSYLNFAGNASHTSIQAQSNGSTVEDIALNPYGGLVLINTTTNAGLSNNNPSAKYGFSFAGGQQVSSTNDDTNLILNMTGGSSNPHVQFRSGGGNTGSISTNGSAIAYNTGSDYRLKENVIPLKDGLQRLNQLKPVQFDWKESQEIDEGFIAHEVQEIVPYVVKGEKDGEEIQTMEYGKLTPLLVKAVQEQQAQIEIQNTLITNLTARIETLEG